MLLSRAAAASLGVARAPWSKLVTLISYTEADVHSIDAAGASLLEVYTVDGSPLRDIVTLFYRVMA